MARKDGGQDNGCCGALFCRPCSHSPHYRNRVLLCVFTVLLPVNHENGYIVYYPTVDVIFPSLSYPWLTGPACMLIACNLFVHYYLVCTIPPGFVDAPPAQPGTSLLWAKPRGGSGRSWARGERHEDVQITKAVVGKCKKCGEPKPEVWLLSLLCRLSA
jgi:hypothetical protein